MSQSASQAAAFYREVAESGVLWTIRDKNGFPAPQTADGMRSQPFWSSRRRVDRTIASVPAYADFLPCKISWSEFCEHWIPGLTRDGIRVGVNWSGTRATGYDVEPEDVKAAVEAQRR